MLSWQVQARVSSFNFDQRATHITISSSIAGNLAFFMDFADGLIFVNVLISNDGILSHFRWCSWEYFGTHCYYWSHVEWYKWHYFFRASKENFPSEIVQLALIRWFNADLKRQRSTEWSTIGAIEYSWATQPTSCGLQVLTVWAIVECQIWLGTGAPWILLEGVVTGKPFRK